MDLKITKREVLKEKPDASTLSFGKVFTDYMLTLDYVEGKGWHNMQIVPYGPIELDPATMVLHYAQETFEGLKAYKSEDGRVLLFRPDMNAKRMINSHKRLCMPAIPEDLFVECVEKIVSFQKDWIPTLPGTALYVRPFCFATEAALGVHAAKSYKFMIVLSPVGSYYKEGLNPVKIFVEDEYVRAVIGGTGEAKCGGNYAASIIAQDKAAKLGFTQVLWLDGVHKKYVEEVGTMNVIFIIDDEVVTGPLEGSILPGITRNSCLTVLRDWGYKVSERRISIDEVMDAAKTGRLKEAFGTGTAAVISPIGQLSYKGIDCVINDFNIGPVTHKLYQYITDIQYGREEDKFGWIKVVK